MAHELGYNSTVVILKTKPSKGLITAPMQLRDMNDVDTSGKVSIVHYCFLPSLNSTKKQATQKERYR